MGIDIDALVGAAGFAPETPLTLPGLPVTWQAIMCRAYGRMAYA